jgi:hypothetical protein
MKHALAPLTLIVTLTFIGSSFLSTFTGFRPHQLPIPQIDPPIQPAGWAFAIWGLIYLGLIASALFGVTQRRTDAAWDRARAPLLGSLVIGTPWLAVAGWNAIVATVMIVVMAALAILALLRAPRADRLWLQAPIALYAGWLTAASWVAIASTAAGYGLVTDSTGWALIGMAGALGVAGTVLWRNPQAPEYALTVIWALFGIAMANGMALPAVTGTAAAGMALLAALALRGVITPSARLAA